jgi:predicted dienelactone hydrolase
MSKIGPYCDAHPEHDLCGAMRSAGVDPSIRVEVPPHAWERDPRIRAAVVLAPAFGFSFDTAGLRDVSVPVQLWRAVDDLHQPHPYYEEAVRAALPLTPEYRQVANAGHYDFLAPCDAQLSRVAPAICKSSPGFDRTAFHAELNAEVIRFFVASLERASSRS